MRDFRKGEDGFGLIELITGIAVFALLFLMVDNVFITAHRGARKAELGANVQQNGRVAIERLTREIREAERGTIQFDPSPTGSWVAFKSARLVSDGRVFCINVTDTTSPLYNPGCSATGNTFAPVWQSWIVYTFDSAAGELRREVKALATPNPVGPGGGDVIAAAVHAFSAKCPGSPMLGTTVCVNLEVEGHEVVQGSEVPPEQIVLVSRVQVRN